MTQRNHKFHTRFVSWSEKTNRLLADHYLTIRSKSNQELIRQGIWKVGSAALFLSVFVGTRRPMWQLCYTFGVELVAARRKCWHMTGAHSQELHTGKFHWTEHRTAARRVAILEHHAIPCHHTIPNYTILLKAQGASTSYDTLQYHKTSVYTTLLKARGRLAYDWRRPR